MKTLNGTFARHDGLEDVFTAFEHLVPVVYVLVLVALFLLGAGREQVALRRGAVAGVMSAAVALAMVQLVGAIVARPRPFVAHPAQVHNFLNHVADSGFPSDHATAASALAVAVLMRSRRVGVLLLGLAALVMAGRVALGVHYPTDVVAGALLGGATAALTALGLVSSVVDRVASAFAGIVDRFDPRSGPRFART